jgi:DNA-directed RNA polymerase specialized sigma24 family protein
MDKYGTHSSTVQVLANLVTTERMLLRRIAMYIGLNAHEAEDAVQEGYMRMHNLGIRPPSIAWAPEAEVRRITRLLLIHNVQFAARDLLRKKIRNNGHISSPECADLVEDATRELVIAVINLGGCAQTADQILSRQAGAFEAFAEKLFELAGLDEEEKRLARYLRDNPGGRDQDFDPHLRPDQISRLKRRMMNKVFTLLYRGTRTGQEGAHR